MKSLFESLQRRFRPEDVAEMVLAELGNDLSKSEKKILDKAAQHSLKRMYDRFTSMAEDFRRPVTPIAQVARAKALFKTAPKLTDLECADPEKIAGLVSTVAAEIRKTVGKSDFLADRLNAEARAKVGLGDMSRRRYNKLFRFLGRLEQKLETFKHEIRKYEAGRIAKSSLSTKISWEDFSADKNAACFVAYFTARCNRRSVFTNQSQDRPYDEVAAMLRQRIKKDAPAGAWRAAAYVMPDLEVVQNLSETDKTDLFKMWTSVLEDIADLMQGIWKNSKFDRSEMIVRRGNDSSTWNALAGAWNAARSGWRGLIAAMGMEELADSVCFGKVMRLMAADVMHWHRASGDTVEPDTLVWADLPAPWEVFKGEATCTRAEVEAVCRKHGIDPEKKGWTAPKQNRNAVAVKATPELVHGVAVSHPALALALRKADWFSGKGAKPFPAGSVKVDRDVHGAALGVSPVEDA